MFYCVAGGKTIQWHTGEDTKILNQIPSKSISEVYADGDELSFILESIKNLPYSQVHPYCVWYGEMARFLMGNLF